MNSAFIFVVALLLVIRGATLSTKYAARLAEGFRLSKYTVGFIIVAVISILPETFIAITAAVNGIPSFGLGVLFGSNVADLTLLFSIIVFFTGRSLKLESKILQNHAGYPLLLLLPLVLGLDGYFSRAEGLALLLSGAAFYSVALKSGFEGASVSGNGSRGKNFALLFFGMGVLLVGSHFTVSSATTLANAFGVDPILIGMLIVGLGTTMPELFFSLKSAKNREDALAVGDILGTVLADATVVVGILALIRPFSFPQRIIYLTGIFMAVAAFLLFRFMRSGRALTRKEASLLFLFWLVFVFVEFFANT